MSIRARRRVTLAIGLATLPLAYCVAASLDDAPVAHAAFAGADQVEAGSQPAATSDAAQPTTASRADSRADPSSSAYRRFSCDDHLILCIDPNGTILPVPVDDADASTPRALPSDLVPTPARDEMVHVRVIGRRSVLSRSTITLSGAPTGTTRLQCDGAGGGTKPAATDTGDGGADAEADAPKTGAATDGTEPDELLATYAFRMPDVQSVVVAFRRTECGNDSHVEREASFDIRLNKTSGFHFEAVLLVPFVFQGSRSIGLASVPGTNEQSLHVSTDLRAPLALALNYFPSGIYDNGPWTRPLGCSSAFRCTGSFIKKRILDPMGIQAGTTFNFSSETLREWYIGLAFEPIRGGSMSAGVAFVRGDFFANGYHDGMIVPSGAVPSGAVDTRYMGRFYFGLAVSPEVLSVLFEGAKAIQNIHPAPTDQKE